MKFSINVPKFLTYTSEYSKLEKRLEEERNNFVQVTRNLKQDRDLFLTQAKHLEEERQQYIVEKESLESKLSSFISEKKELEVKLDEERDYLLNKINDFEEKYLEDYVEQINRLNRVDVVAIPSLLSSKRSLGNKELPLQCAVKEAYAINPTVAACVNVIAQSASLVPFTLRKQGKEGQYSTIFSSPILDLLSDPNKTQTQSEFVEHVVMNLLLCGNALIWKNTNQNKKRTGEYKPGRPVSELIILNPDFIDYKDDGFEITEYLGREKSPLEGNRWDPDEIIHFRLSNPLNMFWGLSPIQAAYLAIDIDSKILNWWMETLENGCKKDMLIKFKHELTDLQYKRVSNLIQQQVSGFRNGRTFMILGHEAQVEFLNLAPAELDFKDSRERSSEDIMAIFRVPPPMISKLDNATLNNSRELILGFWLNTIMPLLNDLASVLSKRLLPNFGMDKRKFSISYDTTEVAAIQSVMAEKWDIITKQVNVGVPLNTAVKFFRLQLPEFKGGDVGYMSHNLVPLGFYEDPKDVGALAGDGTTEEADISQPGKN